MTFVRGQLGPAGRLGHARSRSTTPCLAKVALQEIEGLPPQVRARLNTKGVHPGGRLWSYTVEFRYR